MPMRLPAAVTRLSPFAGTVLRLAVGVIFIAHGFDKLNNGVNGFAGFLASLNVPAPDLMAWLVTILELGGGVLLILGLATRAVALAFVVMMVFTISLVKAEVGLIGAEGAGAEIDLMLLAGALALVLMGPGAASVDGKLGLEPQAGPAA